jgi:hypothetical protein
MTDKKIMRVRIIIAITTFIVLSWILVDMVLKTAIRSSYRWRPNPIELILFVVSFVTLANGVSYLSEILKKDRNLLKILAGILSFTIFVITFFPQGQDMNLIVGWAAFIGLSGSSILISVFSTLEWAQLKIKLRWPLLFLFALNSGIYSCLIFAMILRGYNFSEGGLLLVGYGVIVFVICIIGNFFVVLSLKNKIRGNL